MNISITSPINLKELTIFLERMNNKKSSHIGFCGEDRKEIYDNLMNDFSDLELKDSFLVAHNNSSIVGAIGLDVDLEKRYADVWGPFVTDEDLQIAQNLWEMIILKIPLDVKTFSFFINEDNVFVKYFVLKNKGVDQGSDLVLKITKDSYTNYRTSGLEDYIDTYRESFINLHNQVFPKTYFDGKIILSRLNDFNNLFLVTGKDTDIKGYVYIEANPQHKEGNIEYVAVSKNSRKEGIGKILIVGAINQLFSYPEIEQITICVGGDNAAAINLYRSVGFVEKYKLISYEITRE